jgi:hypothetical protein
VRTRSASRPRRPASSSTPSSRAAGARSRAGGRTTPQARGAVSCPSSICGCSSAG